ncbi:AMP-binding protein [Mycobacterium deserti]|uniref:AMP-binding protein n=1 Tax=Mycobacterium deserti TaxID=2978347 RepID=A0ABT2MF64_9MYCO|nr:AMP-binding protein [Mycobacterium deserti]MCT7660912.1 AMP-binding protein [Mycobacterium deserti]
MTNSSTVSHALTESHDVIARYLRAFRDESSVIVVSPARFELVRSHPGLAGWFVTDCATVLEKLPGDKASAREELVIETSGTTGEPKMVRYTKDAIKNCATAIAESIPLDRHREYIALVNPRLAYGMSIVHSHLLAGVPVRFVPAPVSLDAWTDFRNALRPNSSVYLVPHQSFLLAQDSQWTFDGPLELIFAGGPFTESMAANLRPTFPGATVVNMYGQAELGPRISIGRSPLSDFREGDVGKPLSGVRVRIAGADAPGAPGKVEVASPYQMSSYFHVGGGEEQTPPQWWPTGDVGSLAANGHVHVAGRDAPDVNFLGSRFALSHLRDLVRDVAGVLDCRVSATEHAVYGQQPSIRVLTETPDPTIERRVRKALAADVGSAASAMLIEVIDIASLPESGKL